jgi:hypothetical protein
MNISIVDSIRSPKLFGALPPFKDLSTWRNWLVFFKLVDGSPVTAGEFRIFRKFTDRAKRPRGQFREILLLCGRRAGKSFAAALVACSFALFHEWDLSSLEKGHILCIAKDRAQSRVTFDYIREILNLPPFRGMVKRELTESIELKNNVIINVATCNFRSLRGYKILALIADEAAFWLIEGSNSANEIFRAARPSLGETPGSLLLILTSPYSKAGPVYEIYSNYYGVNDPHTLVWRGSTLEMNPTYDKSFIDREMERDQSAALAEYYSQFRDDVSTFVDPETIDDCTIPGRRELPANENFSYVAFTDPSGGGGQDAFTLSIAHKEGEKIVQDLIRGFFPKFNPSVAIYEFSGILKDYKISEITGDRYAGNFVVSEFEKNGIKFRHADLVKSEIYIEALSYLNTGRVELLDHKKQNIQFKSLERKTGRSRDLVDHLPGAHDDLANSAAGVIVEAARVDRERSYIGTAERSMLHGPD